MHKLALPLAACLIALAAADASAAAIWKWRDASGQIHISDSAPPSDVPDKSVLQRPNGMPAPAADSAAPAQVASASGVDGDLQKKKAHAEKEKAEQDAAAKAALEKKNAAIKADNCQRAQSQAKALESGVRVARLNASGEREYLDDKQRSDELRRANDIASQNCH